MTTSTAPGRKLVLKNVRLRGLGARQPLLSGLHSPVDLRLISATPFGSGVVAMVYQPV
jgi:hypothetical protein